MNNVLRLNFWPLQILGWSGYLLVHFLSAIAHGKPTAYLDVSMMSAAGGFLLTWPVHHLFKRIWQWPGARLMSVLVPLFVVMTLAMGLINAYAIQTYCPLECTPKNIYGYLAYSGSAAMLIMSWTALWFGIRLQRAYADERQRALKAQNQAHDAQIKMLRYQLNPHFLFNTLNAIATLVLDRANDTAERMLGALSRFLRYTLDQDPQQKVPLAREMEILNLYLGIEKMRFDDRLRLELRIDPSLDNALVPSLILQPVIENAIKYAVAKCEQGCTLKIRASSLGERLRIELSDDGPGSPALNKPPNGNGVGLRNTRERLQTLYGDLHRFEVRNRAEGGVEVIIELPLERATNL